MKRDIRTSEKALIFGYAFILLFMLTQDLVALGTLNDIEAVAAEQSLQEIIVITLIGVVQIVFIMGGILFFIGKRYPILVKIWLVIHPSCIFAGAIMSWWIPYL